MGDRAGPSSGSACPAAAADQAERYGHAVHQAPSMSTLSRCVLLTVHVILSCYRKLGKLNFKGKTTVSTVQEKLP